MYVQTIFSEQKSTHTFIPFSHPNATFTNINAATTIRCTNLTALWLHFLCGKADFLLPCSLFARMFISLLKSITDGTQTQKCKIFFGIPIKAIVNVIDANGLYFSHTITVLDVPISWYIFILSSSDCV